MVLYDILEANIKAVCWDKHRSNEPVFRVEEKENGKEKLGKSEIMIQIRDRRGLVHNSLKSALTVAKSVGLTS